MPLTALRKRLSTSRLSFRLKRIGAQKKRGSSPQLWRITGVIPAALAIAVAGCASDGGAGKQGRNLGELGLQQLVLPAAPPLIEAQDAEDVDRAKRLAARYDRRRLERQRRTRLIEAVQTPLLSTRRRPASVSSQRPAPERWRSGILHGSARLSGWRPRRSRRRGRRPPQAR